MTLYPDTDDGSSGMTILGRYDPEPDQEQAALSIHALAIDHLHTHRAVQPAGSRDWVVIQFHDPAPVLLVDGARTLPAETAVIWEPHGPTDYGYPGCAIRHSWLRCRSTRLGAWLDEAGIRPRTALPMRDAPAAAAWWRLLHEECSAGERHDPQLLQGLMRLFLRRLASTDPEISIPDGIRASRRYIATHWQRPLRLTGLARVAGLGRSAFAAAFRRAYGVPPMELVLRLRLAHAATMLEDPSQTVALIATASGFSEACHFSRSFRARYGTSPQAWRRQRPGLGPTC